MGRGDELHPPFRDRPRSTGFQLGSDLIDDDDLWHVVFDRFDHHRVLQKWRPHLHAPRAADAGVRNIAVSPDLV